MLILLPLGTTLPVFVHGPETDAADAIVILFPVEKRKYFPSLARRITAGSCDHPWQVPEQDPGVWAETRQAKAVKAEATNVKICMVTDAFGDR